VHAVETLGDRTRGQPAPPRYVFERLTLPDIDPLRRWLQLTDDEVEPTVLDASEYDLVVWSSIWTFHPQARIRFELAADGAGTRMRFILLDEIDPGPASVGHMRKRLNQLVAELRFSFGQ
jgi:hypothetical protein